MVHSGVPPQRRKLHRSSREQHSTEIPAKVEAASRWQHSSQICPTKFDTFQVTRSQAAKLTVLSLVLAYLCGCLFKIDTATRHQESTNANDWDTDTPSNSSIDLFTNTARRVHAEALAHPALFAHQQPKDVAIIGSANDPLLAELLLDEICKRKTVRRVTIIGPIHHEVKFSQDADVSTRSDTIIRSFASFTQMMEQHEGDDIKFDVLLWADAFSNYLVLDSHKKNEINKASVNTSKLAAFLQDAVLLLSDDAILVSHVGPTPFTERHNPDLLNLQLDVVDQVSQSSWFDKAEVYEESNFQGTCPPQS
jgi:hypothetical protein